MQSKAATKENQPPTCNYCESSNLFTKEKPPHLGLYCGDCGKWIRWIPRNQVADYSTKPVMEDSPTLNLVPRRAEEQSPARACNHSAQLDDLIKSLSGIDRALNIVVRAMCNGVGR